jgi:tRNA-splicing ligase RtcB
VPTDLAPNVQSWASIIDENTEKQAVALSELSFVPRVALMPDAHFGAGSSVGTVIPTKGAIIPAAVGVDIGCGMIAVETRYTKADLDYNLTDWEVTGADGQIVGTGTSGGLDELHTAISRVIPLSPGNYNRVLDEFTFTEQKIVELEKLAIELGVNLSDSPKWREQLGSLGGGNHFIEVSVDQHRNLWLFLHSGSRGVGNKIAQKHIKIAQKQRADAGDVLVDRDHAWLIEGTPEFDTYMRELQWAQRFAYLNRAEMMDRFVDVFAAWMGVDPTVVEIDRINTHHNYTKQEQHDGEYVWLTRKGAVDAHFGVRGVIPGSMGTRSYIVRGKGNEAGLCSAPHGAGRVMSRNKAKAAFDVASLRKAMAGIKFSDEVAEALLDEHPGAYKDIDKVMADAADLVEVEHVLRQILNVKGTK